MKIIAVAWVAILGASAASGQECRVAGDALPDAEQRAEMERERAQVREATRDIRIAWDEPLVAPPRRPPPGPYRGGAGTLGLGARLADPVKEYKFEEGGRSTTIRVMPTISREEAEKAARRLREIEAKEPPLARAIDEGDVGRVRALLGSAADPEPFMIRAAQRWHSRMTDEGEEAARQADIARRYTAILDLLLRANARPPRDDTAVAVIRAIPYQTRAGLRIPGSLETMRRLLQARGVLDLPLGDALALQDEGRFDAMMHFGRPSPASLASALRQSIPERNWPAALRLMEAGADARTIDGSLFSHVMVPAPRPLAVVKALVNAGVDPNLELSGGFSPLMMAMHEHSLMKLLLDRGARVNARSVREGMTALHFAALARAPVAGDGPRTVRFPVERASNPQLRRESVRLLLAGGADPNARDAQGRTALMLTSPDDAEAISLLLAAGGTVNAPQSPVTWALLHGNETLASALLRRDRALARADCAAVHYAAAGGYDNALVLLLAGGAPAGTRSDAGMTPLIAAARAGHAQSVRELLDRRVAQVDERTTAPRGSQANELPAQADPVGKWMAKILQEALLASEAGTTALMLASAAGREEVVKVLLRHDADVNAHDLLGRTALDYAAASHRPGAERVVALLAAKGAQRGLAEKMAMSSPQAVGTTLLFYRACERQVEGFGARHASAFDRWRARHADALAQVERDPMFAAALASTMERDLPRNAAAEQDCGRVAAQLQ